MYVPWNRDWEQLAAWRIRDDQRFSRQPVCLLASARCIFLCKLCVSLYSGDLFHFVPLLCLSHRTHSRLLSVKHLRNHKGRGYGCGRSTCCPGSAIVLATKFLNGRSNTERIHENLWSVWILDCSESLGEFARSHILGAMCSSKLVPKDSPRLQCCMSKNGILYWTLTPSILGGKQQPKIERSMKSWAKTKGSNHKVNKDK